MLADLRGHVNEAKISVEAALAVGESVIVPNEEFKRAMALLSQAAQTLEQVELSEPVLLRFPQVARV